MHIIIFNDIEDFTKVTARDRVTQVNLQETQYCVFSIFYLYTWQKITPQLFIGNLFSF